MLRHVAVTLALLSTGALSAAAAEFVPAWDTDVIWDSNVLRTDTDEESDFQLRTGPDTRLRDQKGDLTYDLLYQLRFEDYLRLNDIRDFDHFVNARGAWQMTTNTRLSVYDNFGDTSSLGSLFEFVGVGPDQVSIVTPQRERITTNTATTELTHRLSPRWSFISTMSHSLLNYEERDQTDSTSFSGIGQLIYAVTPRLTAGFGVQAQRQKFDPVNQAEQGSGSKFFQGFGLFEYHITRTFSISVNAGPAYSIPDGFDQEFQTVDYLAVNRVAVNVDTCPDLDGRTAFDFTQSLGGCELAIYHDQDTGEPVFAVGRNAQGLIFASPTYCENNPCFIPGVTPGQQGVPLQSARVVPVEGQESESTLTYFARIRAEKKWRLWRAELGYQRSASNGSGIGVSTALDTLSGVLEWTPTRNWVITLNANYAKQSSFGDQQVPVAFAVESDDVAPNFDYEFFDSAGGGTAVADPAAAPVSVLTTTTDSAIDITTIRGMLRAQRRIGENLFMDATATYWRQKNAGDFQQQREREIFTIGIGVTWRFDPIVL